MKKISVIQLIDSLNVGGAEVLAVNIANGLSENNIDSHFCVTRKEGVLKDTLNEQVGYVFLQRKKVIDFNAILKVKKYIQENKIGIIHAHSTSYFIAFCVKMLHPKIKIIWHDHFGDSEFLDERKKGAIKMASIFFSAILVVNENLKNWSEKHLLAKKVFFIRNFPLFTNTKKETTLKGIKGQRIVHVAGYRKQKDHLNLLRAFKIISEKHDDWTLHLIGKDYDDAYSKSIQEYIQSSNLKGRVYEYGVCSDMKNVLDQSTIGVLSSLSEGLPISLLEYGLANLPAVTTNVGQCNLIINDKRFVIIPSSSLKLAEALELLISSEENRVALSNKINDKIITFFSKERTINDLIKIYKGIW